MNDQTKAAMQMALEALERHTECYEYPDGCITEEQKAITACREALAQPQDEPEPSFDKDEGLEDNALITMTAAELETALEHAEEAMRIETLEKAAKVCEELADNAWSKAEVHGAERCAAAIRGMK